ncbi:class I SAM-dependent methyltransferase [Lentisphaerota bacterium ZTH]|nr:class I SAM-dependent methyltransferase [Lentisphaerota bacterium]WET07103.1 class I SAM-dependent methyltransferase [Lentisphaerota bacterium ZTH]
MKYNFSKKSTNEDIRKRFDSDVERFSSLKTGQQSTIDAPIAMELITEAAAAIAPHASNVLDIGCGAGNNTLKLLNRLSPLNCDLLDLSMPMLEKARERVSAVNSGKVRIFHEDIRTAGLPENHYDIIIAAAVLHHLRDDADWKQVFSRLFQLCAPGGSIWITDIVTQEIPQVYDMMWNRYGDYLEGIGGDEYKEKVFAYIEKEDTPRPVTWQLDLLRQVGFKKVEILHKNSCFAAYGAQK